MGDVIAMSSHAKFSNKKNRQKSSYLMTSSVSDFNRPVKSKDYDNIKFIFAVMDNIATTNSNVKHATFKILNRLYILCDTQIEYDESETEKCVEAFRKTLERV